MDPTLSSTGDCSDCYLFCLMDFPLANHRLVDGPAGKRL
jgi:hypothetical protein